MLTLFKTFLSYQFFPLFQTKLKTRVCLVLLCESEEMTTEMYC